MADGQVKHQTGFIIFKDSKLLQPHPEPRSIIKKDSNKNKHVRFAELDEHKANSLEEAEKP
jgi:hypothetical protein